MTKTAAFQATVHGFRTVPSRGVISITIECPIEHHVEIARIAEHGAWVAVARLQKPEDVPVKDKRDWRDLPPQQQAGMRCDDPTFQAFLREKHDQAYVDSSEQAAEYVRGFCLVKSRAELSTDQRKRVLWNQLDTEFQAWRALEHA